MDEFGIRPLCPTPRGRIDLVWKDAYGNRDGNVFDVEKGGARGSPVFPIETSRRDRRVRQPVERDVVEDVISRQAFGLSIEDARDERKTGGVVVEYPRGQADGCIVNPVKRLWAERHLISVAQALLIKKVQLVPRAPFVR